MRKIGTFESAQQAEQFHRFLLSEEIDNQVDQQPPVWEIWVVNDDELERAKNEYDSFLNFPDDPRFAVKNLPKPKKSKSTDQTLRRSHPRSDIPITRRVARPLI